VIGLKFASRQQDDSLLEGLIQVLNQGDLFGSERSQLPENDVGFEAIGRHGIGDTPQILNILGIDGAAYVLAFANEEIRFLGIRARDKHQEVYLTGGEINPGIGH
jgi:hypothetical protein